MESSIALVERIGQVALVIGLMVIVFRTVALQFLQAQKLYGSGDSAIPDQQTNCSPCGARISADADTCEYCGEPIGR